MSQKCMSPDRRRSHAMFFEVRSSFEVSDHRRNSLEMFRTQKRLTALEVLASSSQALQWQLLVPLSLAAVDVCFFINAFNLVSGAQMVDKLTDTVGHPRPGWVGVY